MQQPEPLNLGKFYHIYNKGVNNCDLFFEPTNYEHFLKLYDTYISPVADTYAWVLMKNHFHLLVRIKEEAAIGYLSATASSVVSNPYDGDDKTHSQIIFILIPFRGPKPPKGLKTITPLPLNMPDNI